MWIRRVVVIMVVVMMMVVPMTVVMIVMMVIIMVVMVVVAHVQTAHTRAELIAHLTVFDIGTGRIGTLPFDVVVVAFLHRTDLALEPKDLCPVFTEHAGRRRHRTKGRMATLFDTNVVRVAVFQCQNLATITADTAVRRRGITVLFHDPFGKGLKHFGVIPQVACFDELDTGMFFSNLIGEPVDTVDQNTREQEVWEHDHPLVGQHRNVL